MGTEPSAPRPEAPPERSPSPIFVHDFVPLDESWSQAAGDFLVALSSPLLTGLVIESWNAEVGVAAGAGLAVGPCRPGDVTVTIGEGHRRRDAVIVPISWQTEGTGWVAPLEADLELAAFGPRRCHLHLLGRSSLPSSVPPLTTAASLYQRLTVAVVRHVLVGVAGVVGGSALGGGPGLPTRRP